MKIFAISDLHLSFCKQVRPGNWTDVKEYKPMSEIDGKWINHARRIYENWVETVSDDDVVLVAGDISWAMNLEEASPDLDFLGTLPGRIITVQGNHDYWWQGISKVRNKAPDNMHFIQNDHVSINGVAVCGTRGWLCPNGTYFKASDEKIYRRELMRLENSLQSVVKEGMEKFDDLIVMMHYMPTNEKHNYSGFIEIFEKYGVQKVIYGHLHARACGYRLPDRAWGVRFILTSADYVGFEPYYIGDY
ncbi:MAG: phosphohydrolase [Firmicutes bacterium]|nr:phosphohydrolase [Bacillota bacterium]